MGVVVVSVVSVVSVGSVVVVVGGGVVVSGATATVKPTVVPLSTSSPGLMSWLITVPGSASSVFSLCARVPCTRPSASQRGLGVLLAQPDELGHLDRACADGQIDCPFRGRPRCRARYGLRDRALGLRAAHVAHLADLEVRVLEDLGRLVERRPYQVGWHRDGARAGTDRGVTVSPESAALGVGVLVDDPPLPLLGVDALGLGDEVLVLDSLDGGLLLHADDVGDGDVAAVVPAADQR